MNDELKAKKKELFERQQDIAKFFASKSGSFTKDELTELNKKNDDLNNLKGEIAPLEAAEKIRQEVESELKAYGEIERGVGFPVAGKGNYGDELNGKSIGELFVKSSAYKGFNKHERKGPNQDFNLKSVFQTTTANSNTDAPGWTPQILRNGIIVEFPVRTPKMDQVIRTTRTDSPAIMYQQETVWTNGSAFVHEDDATAPESVFKIVDLTEPVKKLRVSIPVSDDMLEDAAFMVDYINNRLHTQIALAKDQALINGNGTGDNLLGLLNRSGLQTGTVTALAGAGQNIDALHKAMTQVLLTSEYGADNIVMHPLNWETIELSQTQQGLYVFGGPYNPSPKRIWGLDVIDTKGIPANTALVGAFEPACTQAIRRDVTMSMSTEHNDNFMRGRLTIKLEMRLALLVYRPAALYALTGLS